MTALDYLRNLPGETISPTELAKAVGGTPYSYNLSAREGRLTLPHLWRGRNLRIFKQPVMRLLEGSVIHDPSNDLCEHA
jgi:hypothetical protein